MAVTVQDFSVQVKAKMSQAIRNALYESGSEVAAHANSNVKMQYDAGEKLRGSYRCDVNIAGNKATIGTPHEEGYWEEFGTGSHADMAKNGGVPGRTEWWVYVPYETPRVIHHINCIHRSEEEAKAVAASWRADGKDAYATDGEEPNYTLEKAFTAKKATIQRIFENDLRGELGQ